MVTVASDWETNNRFFSPLPIAQFCRHSTKKTYNRYCSIGFISTAAVICDKEQGLEGALANHFKLQRRYRPVQQVLLGPQPKSHCGRSEHVMNEYLERLCEGLSREMTNALALVQHSARAVFALLPHGMNKRLLATSSYQSDASCEYMQVVIRAP